MVEGQLPEEHVDANMWVKFRTLPIKCTNNFANLLDGPGGEVKAEVENPAVSSSISKEILKWQGEGSTMKDIIVRLRQRMVPAGHEYHTWTPGKL